MQPAHYQCNKTAVYLSIARCNATEPDVGWRRPDYHFAYLQASFHLLCNHAEIGSNAFDYHHACLLFRRYRRAS